LARLDLGRAGHAGHAGHAGRVGHAGRAGRTGRMAFGSAQLDRLFLLQLLY